MDMDSVDVWYQVEGHAANLLKGFTGKYVIDLLEKIKEKSCLTDPEDMLLPFVKQQGSEEEKSLLELEGESEEFNIKDIVSEYEIRNKESYHCLAARYATFAMAISFLNHPL